MLILVACALAVRAMVPAGWMPMTQADGSPRLVLCPGSGAAPAIAMPGMAMGSSRADAHDDPAAPATGHDCPFAVTALAVDLALPIMPPAARPLAGVERPVRSPSLLPGRGLAAPPLPATGPPTLA